jgi:dienelactone hydrolase
MATRAVWVQSMPYVTPRPIRYAVTMAAFLGLALVPNGAAAQEEFPPPQGKGRVVVVASGHSGPYAYRDVSRRIAALGYDVVLFDSNDWIKTLMNALPDDLVKTLENEVPDDFVKKLPPGDWAKTLEKGLRDAIAQAQRMPHALPGKVGLVGFSLGGVFALGLGTALSEEVAVVAAWYPLTATLGDLPGWAARIRVPTVMFAGEDDFYHRCCLIDKARAMGMAAQAAGAPFELTTYPDAPHGFSIRGLGSYRPQVYDDAFARTEAALKKAMN